MWNGIIVANKSGDRLDQMGIQIKTDHASRDKKARKE